MRKRLIEVERAATLALVGKALEQRKGLGMRERSAARRYGGADRRAGSGHRKEDKALDCIRPVYQWPRPRRRTPEVLRCASIVV